MKNQFYEFRLPVWKRIFDIVVSLIALLLLSPLFLIVALAIRIESRGPIFYNSRRVGSGYRIFSFYKFRSMYTGADKRIAELSKTLNSYRADPMKNSLSNDDDIDLVSYSTILVSDEVQISEAEYIKSQHEKSEKTFVKLESDPRVTRVGSFIRKYSIDELPQLYNVLKGDMSIVGNRPLPLYEAEKLTTDEYVERFVAPSGMTGLWQVERRGEYKMSAEQRKALDVEYAHNFNFIMDIKIILRTFTSFIQKEGS